MTTKELFYRLVYGQKPRLYSERTKRWARIKRPNLPVSCPVCGRALSLHSKEEPCNYGSG